MVRPGGDYESSIAHRHRSADESAKHIEQQTIVRVELNDVSMLLAQKTGATVITRLNNVFVEWIFHFKSIRSTSAIP
jgi:hypothetical protein